MTLATYLNQNTLGVIGAGVMGQTFIKSLLNQGGLSSEQIWACSKTQKTCQTVTQLYGIACDQSPEAFLANTKVLFLSLKPYQMEHVLDGLKRHGLKPDTLIISIVAGKTLHMIQSILPNNPVIRAMPNTPAVVSQAMSVICPGKLATEDDVTFAKALFESVGQCLQLDEHHFDAVTGLCGSGPAYLYLIMEALADGGVRVGIPRDIALQIVAQTVLGSATMVGSSGRHPASLRDDVTTPAGCTIAGLLTLEDGKIRSVLARAVEEATKTARDLG